MSDYRLPDGTVITNVHPESSCAGPCVVHRPTDHHMASWYLRWRDDRGIFERLCAHGIGHPDPDQYDYWRETNRDYKVVHGCDGCCAEPEPQRVVRIMTDSAEFPRDEQWLEFPGDVDYLVSTKGRLYQVSRKRFVPLSKAQAARVPSYSIRNRGYNPRAPRPGSPNRYLSAASMVLLTFVGRARSADAVPVYADGDLTNVALENLSWGKREAVVAAVG